VEQRCNTATQALSQDNSVGASATKRIACEPDRATGSDNSAIAQAEDLFGDTRANALGESLRMAQIGLQVGNDKFISAPAHGVVARAAAIAQDIR